MSQLRADSTLMTSAPMSARRRVPTGPAQTIVRSRMRMPSSGRRVLAVARPFLRGVVSSGMILLFSLALDAAVQEGREVALVALLNIGEAPVVASDDAAACWRAAVAAHGPVRIGGHDGVVDGNLFAAF